MIVQREITNFELAQLLQNIKEEELVKALELYIKKDKSILLKVGRRRPFKPFKAIKLKGKGLTASEMVIRDRL